MSTPESGKAPSRERGRELQLVSFHVGAEEFGLDIARVQEIIRMQPLTRVPNSPSFAQGVINLRGKVIPALSLRKRFELEERPVNKEMRIIIVQTGGAVLGLIVDWVSEVIRLTEEMIEAPPRLHKGEREYVGGVGKVGERLLIVLDVDRLVSEKESAMATEPASERT